MAIQLRNSGWALMNDDTTEKWYDGLYHNIGTPRDISYDDIDNGIIDDKSLQNDIMNGLTGIGPSAAIWDRVYGQAGLDLLFSLTTINNVPMSYSFSRSGEVPIGTWLKVGEVPSNSGPHGLTRTVSKMKMTVANGIYIDTTFDPALRFEAALYERINWNTFNLIHTVVMENVRTFSEVGYFPVAFAEGTEICVKIIAGLATNPVVTIEAL